MLGRKVIYVRCINFLYNNVTKGIRLLDTKTFFVYTGKNFMLVRAFERYIPLRITKNLSYIFNRRTFCQMNREVIDF